MTYIHTYCDMFGEGNNCKQVYNHIRDKVHPK
jgi:hypothetical protein